MGVLEGLGIREGRGVERRRERRVLEIGELGRKKKGMGGGELGRWREIMERGR